MKYKHTATNLGLIVTLLSALTNCAATDKDHTGIFPDGGDKICDPNDAVIPCFVGKTEPCNNFSSGYAGDELCMKPPINGFQYHIGPTNYDDPNEIEKWILPAGGYDANDPRAVILGSEADVNWCYYMKTPNDAEIFTGEYYSHMRPGSHHFIMFGLAADSDLNDSTAPESCSGQNSQVASGANFLAGATRRVQNAAMVGDTEEDKGLGTPTAAHQQLNMNLHFVNPGETPVLQEIWVNMIEKPAGEVTSIIKAIEWLGGLGMDIPPAAHQVLQSDASVCSPPFDDTRILGITAHMHSSTTRVSMYRQVAGSSTKELIFDDFNWEEPTVWLFNSKFINESPDRVVNRSGSAFNGTLVANTKDKFTWECEVQNNTNVNLQFSDKAFTGEMCNVFGMYAEPAASKPWQCFFF